jgi:LCP family protein required for cell wall assembly
MKLRALALVAVIAVVATLVPHIGDQPADASGVLVGRVHGRFQPNDGKIYVLLIGHDARPGESRARADAIHIAGINTKTMKGGILNFPRDSFVAIPGYGSQRINAALFFGGPELLARTLENITGIRIDYWVVAGFQGFQDAVVEIGGVKMNVPTPVYDRGGSGAQLNAGTQRLKGYQALAYMRARKPFVGGDAIRTTNQGRFLLAALRKFGRETSDSPSRLFRWMEAVRTNMKSDLSPDEMFRLGVLASQVKSKDVGNVTVPTSGGSVGAASVLYISPAASSIYARFRRGANL